MRSPRRRAAATGKGGWRSAAPWCSRREAKPPRALEAFAQATRRPARHDDPLRLDAVRAYFQELYWQKGEAALDARAWSVGTPAS